MTVRYHSDFRMEWVQAGIARELNGEDMKVVLDNKALELIVIAKAVWEAKTKHESAAPKYYGASFYTARKQLYGLPAVDAGNNDPEWFFVEFGIGHGKSLPGYKYRVLGTSLDTLVALQGDVPFMTGGDE